MNNIVDDLPSKEERNWALVAHLSALAGMVVPFAGTILGPLVVWLLKREESAFVADQAREALNFNITMFIAYAICFVLFIVFIGMLLLPLLALVHLILIIVAMIKASEGQRFRYPFALRLIS
jgi:uncharacterized Tic20 family protein